MTLANIERQGIKGKALCCWQPHNSAGHPTADSTDEVFRWLTKETAQLSCSIPLIGEDEIMLVLHNLADPRKTPGRKPHGRSDHGTSLLLSTTQSYAVVARGSLQQDTHLLCGEFDEEPFESGCNSQAYPQRNNVRRMRHAKSAYQQSGGMHASPIRIGDLL